jgi:hypothetical protein
LVVDDGVAFAALFGANVVGVVEGGVGFVFGREEEGQGDEEEAAEPEFFTWKGGGD